MIPSEKSRRPEGRRLIRSCFAYYCPGPGKGATVSCAGAAVVSMVPGPGAASTVPPEEPGPLLTVSEGAGDGPGPDEAA